MEIKKGSDLILILRLEDIKGRPLRVKDTAHIKIYVWTANRNNYLVFNKRDILTEGNVDRIAIPSDFMNTLETGVVCYTYDYAMWDSSFKHTDCMYNKVKEVVTDLLWENSNYNQIPANPINYQTLEYIKDLIEEERLDRIKADKHFEHFLKCEYTDKLNDEVKRSTEVDIEMLNRINSNKEATDKDIKAVTDKLNEEIRRSNEVDIEFHKLLKDNSDSTSDKIDDVTTRFTTALNTEISRATTKENEIATNLTTEINRVTAEINTTRDSIEAESNRAKAAEKQLTDSLNAETDRAIERENAINSKVNELIENLGDEIERSLEKDREHKQEIDIEVNRAKAEENRIDTALQTEVSRSTAKDAELTSAIQSEMERAKTVEKDITESLQALKSSVANKNTEVTDALTAEINRAKAAEKELTDNLAAEVSRATDKENELASELEKLNQSIKDTDSVLTYEITRSLEEDESLRNGITAAIKEFTKADEALTEKVNEEISRAKAKESELKNNIDSVETAVNNEVTRATAKEKEIADSVAALSGTVANEVKRSTDKDAELTKALSDEVTRAISKDAEHTASITAINQALEVINGADTVVGSINHGVADSKHYTDDEIAKLKATVGTDLTNTLKDYATKTEVDNRIKDVIGTAPAALDTLGEIADKLSSNDDAVSAIVNTLSEKANSADVYTKSDVDAKVTTINSTINAEVTRATAAENKVATDLTTEVSRAKDAEQALSDKIDKINGDASVIGSIAHSLEDAKHYTDDEISKLNVSVGNSIAEEVARATRAEKANADAIVAEADRAKAVEAEIKDSVAANKADIAEIRAGFKVEGETLVINI